MPNQTLRGSHATGNALFDRRASEKTGTPRCWDSRRCSERCLANLSVGRVARTVGQHDEDQHMTKLGLARWGREVWQEELCVNARRDPWDAVICRGSRTSRGRSQEWIGPAANSDAAPPDEFSTGARPLNEG
ncbi:hypothetical protein TRVL_07476 [Trypanosoma vivax]|nr:hypothetical protein TRVL_07476 [Trypanosoma vivax]